MPIPSTLRTPPRPTPVPTFQPPFQSLYTRIFTALLAAALLNTTYFVLTNPSKHFPLLITWTRDLFASRCVNYLILLGLLHYGVHLIAPLLPQQDDENVKKILDGQVMLAKALTEQRVEVAVQQSAIAAQNEENNRVIKTLLGHHKELTKDVQTLQSKLGEFASDAVAARRSALDKLADNTGSADRTFEAMMMNHKDVLECLKNLSLRVDDGLTKMSSGLVDAMIMNHTEILDGHDGILARLAERQPVAAAAAPPRDDNPDELTYDTVILVEGMTKLTQSIEKAWGVPMLVNNPTGFNPGTESLYGVQHRILKELEALTDAQRTGGMPNPMKQVIPVDKMVRNVINHQFTVMKDELRQDTLACQKEILATQNRLVQILATQNNLVKTLAAKPTPPHPELVGLTNKVDSLAVVLVNINHVLMQHRRDTLAAKPHPELLSLKDNLAELKETVRLFRAEFHTFWKEMPGDHEWRDGFTRLNMQVDGLKTALGNSLDKTVTDLRAQLSTTHTVLLGSLKTGAEKNIEWFVELKRAVNAVDSALAARIHHQTASTAAGISALTDRMGTLHNINRTHSLAIATVQEVLQSRTATQASILSRLVCGLESTRNQAKVKEAAAVRAAVETAEEMLGRVMERLEEMGFEVPVEVDDDSDEEEGMDSDEETVTGEDSDGGEELDEEGVVVEHIEDVAAVRGSGSL